MNKDIFSKWFISGIEGYCFGSDKELYRLPFKSGRNYFGLRKLKKQPMNRWKIDGKWWSERQLKAKIYLNPNPEIIVKNQDNYDALLISKAPEMLEMLERLQPMFEDLNFPTLSSQIEELIKSATEL